MHHKRGEAIMLAIVRKNAIREQLQEHKSVRITELAKLLNVTKETIRRDLREMEQDGDLIRTHGGAYILDGVQNDIDVSTRQVIKIPEKEIIAKKCDSLIQSGDYIYLDGSTTAWFIAKAIAHRKLTVLTPSLEIIKILSTSDTIKLHAIGGEFNQSTMSFTGNGALRNLEQYYVDKAIISCRSISMEFGITDTNDHNAAMHKVALSHSRQKYLVVDHTKLDIASFSFVSPLSVLDGIVMDREFPDAWKQFLTQNGVRII